MSIVCQAFLIEDHSSSQYLVNQKNLAAFLHQHKSVKEVVITGPFKQLFVLSMREGKISYCSDEKLKREIEEGMEKLIADGACLYQYQVIANKARAMESVNVFSDSRWQALKDFTQWSLFPPHKVKLV